MVTPNFITIPLGLSGLSRLAVAGCAQVWEVTRMLVEIDGDKCIGSGSCEMLLPEVFEVGEDGLAHVLDPDPPAELSAKLNQAVESCPTTAISVTA
jgi:ferredoxin